MFEGYEQVKEGDACAVYMSAGVSKFLLKHAKRNEKSRKEVERVANILTRLSEFGPMDQNNTEQFKHEGKFVDGRKGGKKSSVYVVKKFQIRVYGGFVMTPDRSNFLCIEAAIKKQKKADQAQLRRVAKALGEQHERN